MDPNKACLSWSEKLLNRFSQILIQNKQWKNWCLIWYKASNICPITKINIFWGGVSRLEFNTCSSVFIKWTHMISFQTSYPSHSSFCLMSVLQVKFKTNTTSLDIPPPGPHPILLLPFLKIHKIFCQHP